MGDAPSAGAKTWLAIIGIGEDGVEGLGTEARALIANACLVVGGRRHLDLAAPLIRGDALTWSAPLGATWPAILARRGRPVVVLASGDPFCFGVGRLLSQQVPPAETRVLPQASSLALAAARLGLAEQDCTMLSLCGRPLASLRPALQPGTTVLVLSADATTPGAVCDALTGWGFGPSHVTLLEALGGPAERIRASEARAFDLTDVHPVNLLAIRVAAEPDAMILPQAPGLPDDWFEHDGQITKREVRAVTLSSLRPTAGALLWDIGCGSGSIAIEWLLAHPTTRAIALDRDPQRALRAGRNAERLGVPRLDVRLGSAPAALADWPMPDAIFIGGGGQDAALIEACWAALRPGGRLVVNAVALATQQQLIEARDRHGGDLVRLAVERLDRIGRFAAFRPAMPAWQWVAVKP